MRLFYLSIVLASLMLAGCSSLNLSSNKQNITACNALPEQQGWGAGTSEGVTYPRSDCLLSLAKNTSDISICVDYLNDSADCGSSVAISEHSFDACSGLRGTEAIAACELSYIVATGEFERCSSLRSESQANCYYQKDLYYYNTGACSSIEGNNLKNHCYLNYALTFSNSSYCAFISGNSLVDVIQSAPVECPENRVFLKSFNPSGSINLSLDDCYAILKQDAIPCDYPLQENLSPDTSDLGERIYSNSLLDYQETEYLNASGISINFEPAIGNGMWGIHINHSNWTILSVDPSDGNVLIANETSGAHICIGDKGMMLGNRTITFSEWHPVYNPGYAGYVDTFTDGSLNYTVTTIDTSVIFGNLSLYDAGIDNAAMNCRWMTAYTGIVNLSAQNGISLEWENDTFGSSLSSIYVTKTSPLFEKLTNG